jgi:hypothetical protein
MAISSEAVDKASYSRSSTERSTTSPNGRRGMKPRNGINLKFKFI